MPCQLTDFPPGPMPRPKRLVHVGGAALRQFRLRATALRVQGTERQGAVGRDGVQHHLPWCPFKIWQKVSSIMIMVIVGYDHH